MAIKSVIGIKFTQPSELLLIITQLLCYANSYYLHVFLLGPLSFPLIVLITLTYSRPISALLLANSTHAPVSKPNPST